MTQVIFISLLLSGCAMTAQDYADQRSESLNNYAKEVREEARTMSTEELKEATSSPRPVYRQGSTTYKVDPVLKTHVKNQYYNSIRVQHKVNMRKLGK